MRKGSERKMVEEMREKITAKKDFLIVQNRFRLDIKKGDDLSAVPKRFYQNLKTEGVI